MKIEGIICTYTDYMESSKIVNAYTPLGFIGIKARGIKDPKKGNSGFSTPGLICEMVLTDTKLHTLTEYHAVNNPFNLASDIDKIKAFTTIMEIIKSIPEDSNHKAIYEFVKKAIIALEDTNPNKVLSIFAIKMLYVFGVTPNLKTCVKCNNSDTIGFSISLGGSLCSNCGSSDNILPILKEYYYSKLEFNEYTDTDFNELLAFIKEYYTVYVPSRIKFNI